MHEYGRTLIENDPLALVKGMFHLFECWLSLLLQSLKYDTLHVAATRDHVIALELHCRYSSLGTVSNDSHVVLRCVDTLYGPQRNQMPELYRATQY
jgi:hypothetical protein